ncbi:cyclophilin-like fold protein [Streptococcus ruminantium]|uniref:cyclophilin-like fold protein n=2 Tax=Streptococcus ruminantium TaxID=1917441 RepID=UPI0012DE8CC5|nr:cyclophilin-like fold protein [Streptococcus ruminantium]
MKRTVLLILSLCMILVISGCNSSDDRVNQTNDSEKSLRVSSESESKMIEDVNIKLYLNDKEVEVIWENNAAIEEIFKDVKNNDLIVEMSMYGGFEQVGDLGKRYTQNDKQITTKSGDIVIYGGDKIVVFYGSNTWEYTKLGKINESEYTITNLLSKGNIELKISKD